MLRQQTITHAGFSEQVTRLPRIHFELAPQPREVDVEVVRLRPIFGSPHLFEQHTISQDFVWVRDENLEQFIFSWRQMHFLPEHGHPPVFKVDFEIARPKNCGLPAFRARRVAQRHPNTGEQFVHAERLGEVVVGAKIERRHLVEFSPTNREHNDRSVPEAAHAPDDVDAVDIRQAKVEQHKIGA